MDRKSTFLYIVMIINCPIARTILSYDILRYPTKKLYMSSARINFFDLQLDELRKTVISWEEKPFRAQQLHRWVYERGVSDPTRMDDLPQSLREKIQNYFNFGSLKIASEQISKDGTRKRAYELHDGQLIESVLMPYDDGRQTACISSQAGCAMGCVFCATGQMGFSRQLTSTEIFEQVQKYCAELIIQNQRLSNVVLMGMVRTWSSTYQKINILCVLRESLSQTMKMLW